MLTDLTPKWVNTLYLDKLLQYEKYYSGVFPYQSSFGPDKPFGTIKYYRYPHTMEKNIEAAVALYSETSHLPSLFRSSRKY